MESKRTRITQSTKERGKSDLNLDVTSKAGVKFRFVVHRNRVDIDIIQDSELRKIGKASRDPRHDWRKALSEEQKLKIFAIILDEYRKHSIGDEHGYRGAALGVSGNRIFLGANTATEQLASSYFKECAEQNMVNAASDLLAYEQVKNKGWDTNNRPQAPKFDELYMMGGISQNNIPISCPCGKCTDMLAKNMASGGKIYALPLMNAAIQKEFRTSVNEKSEESEFGTSLAIHRSQSSQGQEAVKNLAGLPRHAQHFDVWQTTINHLNAKREIHLTDKSQHIAHMQRDAYRYMCKQAVKDSSLSEREAEIVHQRALTSLHQDNDHTHRRGLFAMLFTPIKEIGKTLHKKILDILGIEQTDAVRNAAENQFLGRDSNAVLDAAVTKNGIDTSVINRFMLREIKHIIADRVHSAARQERPGVDWVRRNIPNVRCVVTQLDDGTFHHVTQATGAFDASMPNAEAALVNKALPSLGRAGIRHVWVMEMNAQAIEQGILPTSPKEGVERLVKRASKEGVNFHFIPFNKGDLNSQTLNKISIGLKEGEIFPALFRGSRPLDAPEIAARPQWQHFLEDRLSHAGYAGQQR